MKKRFVSLMLAGMFVLAFGIAGCGGQAGGSPEASGDPEEESLPTINPKALVQAKEKGLDVAQNCRGLTYYVSRQWDFFKDSSDDTYFYDANEQTLTVHAIRITDDDRTLIEQCEKNDNWDRAVSRWTDFRVSTPGREKTIPGAVKAWSTYIAGSPVEDEYLGCIIVGDEYIYHLWFTAQDIDSSPFGEVWEYILATAEVREAEDEPQVSNN